MERDPAQRWSTARDFSDVLAQSAGDFLSPLTDPGMWRCKWCNAVSSVESRYCTQCNWDGMESCPECEGETRVGVRFCGQCSTDIKAFEDMRALLNRLREFRRQKDFDRIKEAGEAVSRFQPRGVKGRELVREIQELGETASWALKRKDELTQAINNGVDRQNYEEVQERLNEYGVLDDGPEYKELRNELPWRIAERNIISLRAELSQIRQLMGEKRPEQAQLRLSEMENRFLSLGQLEAQFPALKGALTPDHEHSGAYAKAVAELTRDTEQVKKELGDTRQSIEREVQAASMALKNQDYDGCLKCCEALKEITLETSLSEALVIKATEQNDAVFRLLTRAGDALRKGDLRPAERAARDVLERYKQDSVPARQLLAQIRRLRRKRAAGVWSISLAMAAALYVLSIGPMFQFMMNRGVLSVNTRDTLHLVYQPVYWLHAHTPLRIPLERYASYWEPAIFEVR
jgi:hypothetical protein